MAQSIIVAPSILAANFACLADEVAKVRQAPWLHVDVMDGAFVPNITLGPPVVASLRKYTDQFFDVHLMISQPDRFVPAFAQSGADQLTVHVEACQHLHRTIMLIREHNLRVGVALNPHTPIGTIEWILPEVDMVLIMTVNPGFGGQAFIDRALDKVRDLNAIIQRRGLAVDIQVDGGIDEQTVQSARSAGANILVAGSAVFQQPDPERAWKRLVELAHATGAQY